MGRIHGVPFMLPRARSGSRRLPWCGYKNTGTRVPLNQANVLLNQAPLILRR